jgi:flagellar hook-basal body complex protein FliE
MLPITTGSYLPPVLPGGGAQTFNNVTGASFGEYFQNALGELEGLEAQKAQDSYLLSIGEVDDIAAIELTSQKAQTMMTMLVQMRNTLVDSYNEIMRMNI